MAEQESPTPGNEAHLCVLRLLQANPLMTQRALADALGVSLGKVNYCIRHLLGKGMVKMRNIGTSSNKLRYAYLLTPSGVRAKARLSLAYLDIKLLECESLKREIELLRSEASRSASTSDGALQ